ncbi:unnamed protein product, partial [Discosporangium mesarthrocarpum]
REDENAVILGERYRIIPSSPIVELGTKGAKAYVARNLKNPSEALFARICEPNVFPRVEVMVQLKNMREAAAIIPEDWGPVFWPVTGQRCFAIIFRRPDGGPVMSSLKSQIPKIDSEKVISSLLIPALTTLSLFERRKITHRTIRPDNVFTTEPENGNFVFGDCVSVPPSWGQSTIFETIESSMTPAVGRGKGTTADDLYALGATMLFMGLGHCPVAHMSDRELLAAKVENGSFVTLLGGEVIPGGLREPIRGMLSDDPADRWTLEDLTHWTSGTLRRNARPIREYKTDRPVKFRDREYRNTRLLAHAYGLHWKEAAAQLKSKEFDTWLHRGLSDADLVEVLEGIIAASAGSDGELGDAKLVTRICSALDPEGPLKYKGLTVMPDGMGYALSAAVEDEDKETIKLVTELVQKGIASDWFEQKIMLGRSDLTLEAKTFKKLQQFVRHSGPGYGVERVLYELNPFLPCRSKLVASAYVYSLRDLLPALDKVVEETGNLGKLVDRHIAAFIASRIKGSLDSQLAALEHTTGVSVGAKIGMTGLLAKVQNEYQHQMTPNLTNWLVEELQPAVKRYNSKSLRKRISDKLDQIAVTGNLIELYQTLSNKNIVAKDEKAQSRAKREYTDSMREIKRLESEEFQFEAKRTGWRIAAGISLVIGTVTTIGVFSW